MTSPPTFAEVVEAAVGVPLDAPWAEPFLLAAADRLDAVVAALTPGPSAHDVHLLARLTEAAGMIRSGHP